jgi:heme/copper-type cytochrome/quinol oxidase subunit 3
MTADIPGFVGPAAGGLIAISLFVISTQRGDIRDLASREATEKDWGRQWRKAVGLLILATLLLAAAAVVAVPAAIELAEGETPSTVEWVAMAAVFVGSFLWWFGLGNVRGAARNLATLRERLYGKKG